MLIALLIKYYPYEAAPRAVLGDQPSKSIDAILGGALVLLGGGLVIP